MNGTAKFGKTKQVTVITGCVIDHDHVLLTQRNEPELPDADRKWDLPGGKMEFGETPEETIQRELKEELGLEVSPQEMIPYVKTNVWHYKEYTLHAVVICYVCQLTPQLTKIIPKLDEIRKVKWFKIDEINLNNTLPGIKDFLTWVAEKKFNFKLKDQASMAYVHLVCRIPEKNINKYYILSEELPSTENERGQLLLFGKENFPNYEKYTTCYLLRRSSGRTGSHPKSIMEEYYSEAIVKKRMAELFRQKLRKGYKLFDSNLGGTTEQVFEHLQEKVPGS